ncbi:MAG: sulfurtransferase TusA family protein [Anaerolineae bacterium]|jgi:tRNA 2-thiouridine synthesizing protein A|nr:SirA family protein [Chloroflexota bacterium]
MEPVLVDARGYSCPQPVIMVRKALGQLNQGPLRVLVDGATSRDNVTRLAQREGLSVESQATADGGFELLLTR